MLCLKAQGRREQRAGTARWKRNSKVSAVLRAAYDLECSLCEQRMCAYGGLCYGLGMVEMKRCA